MDESLNIAGRISHFFTVNRPLSTLLLIVVLLFGLFSFTLTPKQYNPEIVRPAFAMTLTYDGASVEEAVDRVVYELVEKIRTVPGVDEVYTEVHDGTTIATTVIFEVGYDATDAKLDLLSQIEQHRYLATGLITGPVIHEIDPETIPVLQIVFTSDTLALPDLRGRVTALAHTLGGSENVSEVTVHGGYTPSLVVEVDPHQLATLGVTIGQVTQALERANVRAVGGGVSSDGYRVPLLFDGRTATPSDVGALIVAPTVRVRDIAVVYEGIAGDRSYLYHATKEARGEAVVLAVSKREGSSAPVVTRDVLGTLVAELNKGSFETLSYRVVGNDGETASREIYGLTKNLLTSIVIVALVLMLFLSVRAALVVLIAIPVTLLIVFGLGFLFDQTINRITLFALILSLGLLVDSAIVVVENIFAHLKQWREERSPRAREQVIAGAVHEIGVGLVLSAVTSVIVFLPMAYITGMMGPYMGPIAFFVPAALIVSLVVAIVVTPFVASHLIGDEEKMNPVNKLFSDLLDKLVHRYSAFLRRVLADRRKQRRLLVGALLLVVVSLILPLSGLVHFQMLPKADRDQLYVYVDLPVDRNAEAVRAFTEEVDTILLADPDVTSTQAYVGQAPVVDFNGMFKGAQHRYQAYQASTRVNLTPAAERTRSSSDITEALRLAVAETLGEEARHVRFMEEPPGPPVRATFVAHVSSPDSATEAAAVQTLYTGLEQVAGVVDRYTSRDVLVGRTVFRFDHEAAAALGVSVDDARQAFALLSGPVTVTEFAGSASNEFVPVELSIPHEARRGPADVTGLMVPTASGGSVPLAVLVSVETEARPSRVDLDGSTRVTYVTAEVVDRPIIYAVLDIYRLFAEGGFPGLSVTEWGLFGLVLRDEATGETVRIDWGGEWEMTLENFRDLGIAMGVALLLVYGVLVAQYNRFATPAYILVTVPLGLIGILWGFLVLDRGFGIYLTATALIGFIALIGIVVNNAIIYLEYVEQMKQTGKSFSESLVAAGEARIRPILLTSLTTVLGSLTIASDPVWSGLAWAIVFGLSLSTILTLVMFPTLLRYFARDGE